MKKKICKIFGFKLFLLLVCFLGLSGRARAVSLSLEESVNMALDHHYTIESAAADVQAARWQMSSARRAAGPTLGWNWTAFRLGGRDYNNVDYNRSYSNTLTLSWPFYTGGGIEANIDAARYQANSADMGLEGTKQKVRYDAIEAYYGFLQKEHLLRVAEEGVYLVENVIQTLTVQFNEGAIARSEVLQMEVQLASYQKNLIGARGDLAIARDTLASVIGLPEGTEIHATDTLSYTPYPMTLDACVEYALRNRPDKAAAEYAVKRAKANERGALSQALPTVAGVLQRGIVGDDPFNQNQNSNWQAGVQVTWTIFDNLATEAKVNAARKAADKLIADAEETTRTVRLDTRKAYEGMRAAESKIDVARVGVEKAERNNTLAEVRYREGVDIILNLIDAEDKLIQARTDYYMALYEYNLYRAGLDRAMGVPVNVDVPRYRTAEADGRSPRRAEEIALIAQPGHEGAERGGKP